LLKKSHELPNLSIPQNEEKSQSDNEEPPQVDFEEKPADDQSQEMMPLDSAYESPREEKLNPELPKESPHVPDPEFMRDNDMNTSFILKDINFTSKYPFENYF